MKTMGEALDEAIERHECFFPESEVYSACIAESEVKDDIFRVEIRANHFSRELIYNISAK